MTYYDIQHLMDLKPGPGKKRHDKKHPTGTSTTRSSPRHDHGPTVASIAIVLLEDRANLLHKAK